MPTTPEFNSPEMLVAHIARNLATAELKMQGELKHASLIVQTEAQAKLGHYQGPSGPFVGWAPLAASTQAERVRKGYPANEPLLRDGTLRDAIEIEVHHDHAFVGVKSGPTPDGKADIGDVAVYLESGTAHMPPRPFLGPALHETREEIIHIIRKGVFGALRGIATR